MSLVTSAVIFISYAPQKVHDLLDKPLDFDPRQQSFRDVDPYTLGGSKLMEAHVYAGGFNYVDPGQLESWFQQLPWGEAGSAVLIHSTGDGFEKIVTTPKWNSHDT